VKEFILSFFVVLDRQPLQQCFKSIFLDQGESQPMVKRQTTNKNQAKIQNLPAVPQTIDSPTTEWQK